MVPDAAVSAAAMPRCRQGGAGAVRHAVKAPGGELWRATAGENNTSMTGLNGEHNWAWCIAPLVWVRVALAVPLFMYSTACRGHVIACEGRADIIVNPSKYSIDTHISLTRSRRMPCIACDSRVVSRQAARASISNLSSPTQKSLRPAARAAQFTRLSSTAQALAAGGCRPRPGQCAPLLLEF
jgi:hypothetical protein